MPGNGCGPRHCGTGHIDAGVVVAYTGTTMPMERTTIYRHRRAPMPRVKIGTRHQVTLPAETLKRLGLDAGEELEVVEHNKMILLVPRKHIPKDQEWYYTDAWQRMMQEAFDDLKAGRIRGPFEPVEEFKQALKTRAHR